MDTDNKWLVKSSDTISGPYQFDEVVQHIFSGDIHLLDEIKGPFERWRIIKDHSLFAAAIERLKATTYTRREETMTHTLDLNTKTHELTKTHTLTHPDELSQTPKIETNESSDSVHTVRARPAMMTSSTYPANPAGSAQSQSRVATVFIVSFLLMIVAGGAFLVFESTKVKNPVEQTRTAEQLTDEALSYLKVGDYQKSLNNFILAYNLSGSDANIILEMAPLSVQFDGQFSHVEIMVENLLATNYKKDSMKRGKNIVGMTHSYRGRYKDSLKHYDEALEVDGNYFPAQINKAFALIKLGEPEVAVKQLKKVVGSQAQQPLAHYLFIRALVESGIKTETPNYFEEALSVSQQFDQRFSDFKQEVLFFKALAKKELGATPKELEVAVRSFLRVDPELTNLHVHDTHIDFQSFNWLDFNNACQGLSQSLEGYMASLTEGFCFLKNNRILDAKKRFETLLADHNKDGALQSLYASTLLKLDDNSPAKNVLGFISQIDDKQPVVETVLRGCLLVNNMSCSEAVFKGKHGRHISLLYSHWGNSEILFASDRGGARNSINLGLEISPNFAPLLKLKRRL
jgi:Tfp pilus assembly protein PilF